MNGNTAVARVIAAFDELHIDYMLVGSYSSNAYGIPRATNDADFVVALESGAINMLMVSLGEDFRINPQIEFETVTGTIRRIIEFLPVSFEIELFEKSGDPFDCQRFDRRVQIPSVELSATVWLPTAEDVIIQKLRWGRDKDLSDAADVVAVQNEVLDWDYIHRWTREHKSVAALQRIIERL